MSDKTTDPPLHWHRFGAFHRHPDWHGHCTLDTFELDGVTYTDVGHTCGRWHFHLPFRHRHTETGR